jgi:hypothetical protein
MLKPATCSLKPSEKLRLSTLGIFAIEGWLADVLRFCREVERRERTFVQAAAQPSS